MAIVVAITLVPAAFNASAQTKVWHVGVLHVGLDHEPASKAALQAGLRAIGHIEGKTLRFDWRNQASEEAARAAVTALAAEKADIIVVIENQAIRAAIAANVAVPIFFMQSIDPRGNGFVQDIARPGGNVTGFSSPDLLNKRIQLLGELRSAAHGVVDFIDRGDAENRATRAAARLAATRAGLEFKEIVVASAKDIEAAFTQIDPSQTRGISITSSSLTTNHRRLFLRLAAERGLPLITHNRQWADEGALMSYGVDYADMGRAAASYVERILSGAKPGDLPVNEAAGVKLVVNRKTAKALGLELPDSIQSLADEVIE